MFSSSLTNLLVHARVEDRDRAARAHGSSRRRTAAAGEADRSPAAALAAVANRSQWS
jgi:hypothetical protein